MGGQGASDFGSGDSSRGLAVRSARRGRGEAPPQVAAVAFGRPNRRAPWYGWTCQAVACGFFSHWSLFEDAWERQQTKTDRSPNATVGSGASHFLISSWSFRCNSSWREPKGPVVLVFVTTVDQSDIRGLVTAWGWSARGCLSLRTGVDYLHAIGL